MSRSCCKLHSLRTRIAVRILPPCLREAFAMGAMLNAADPCAAAR